MTIIERTFEALEAKNRRMVDLSTLLSLNSSTIANWKTRNTDPPAKYIAQICEFLEVSIDWLLTGEEPKSKSASPADALPAANKSPLSVEERLLLDHYHNLSNEKKLELQKLIAAMVAVPIAPAPQSTVPHIAAPVMSPPPMAAQSVATKPSKTAPTQFEKQTKAFEKRIYYTPASAGLGYYLGDDEPYQMVYFNEDSVPAGADCGIRIKGSSMEPDIKDGSIVWVSYQPTINDGEIGIFVYGGESFCKKLEIDKVRKEIRLVSFNENYKPLIIKNEDELKTVGKVIGTISPDASFF